MCLISPVIERSRGGVGKRGRFLLPGSCQGLKLPNSFIINYYFMDFNISIQNFETLNLLGQGTYAKVFLVKHKPSNQLMAAKVMKKKFVQKKKAVSQILNQKNILSELEHPFVMKLNFSFHNKHNLFLMIQYCPGGELFRLLEKKGKLNENQACFYAVQIAQALQYLHDKNIVYRDLKPENVVIDQKGYIKITDFGLAGYLPSTKTDLLGTPEYFAPEIVLHQENGKQVDWWCFGLIIYEMVVGESAFLSNNRTVLMEKIVGEQPHYPKTMSNKLKNLLQLLLKKNSQQRLGQNGVSDILEHPWFQKMDVDQILKKQAVPPMVPTLKSKIDVSNFDSKFTVAMFQSLEEDVSESDTDDEHQQTEDLFKGFQCINVQLPAKKLKIKSKVSDK